MAISPRYITSLIMTAVYLLITLLPLSPLAMRSARIAHAFSGECSGECSICGCSAERSAARTCCCWQKKLAKMATASRNKSGSCALQQAPSNATQSDCCKRKPENSNDDSSETDVVTDNTKSDTDSLQAVITACPCGSAKHMAIHGLEGFQHYPFIFSVKPPSMTSLQHHSFPPARFSSLHSEPPEPPPKATHSA